MSVNSDFHVLVDYLPVLWKTHSCEPISPDKTEKTEDQLVADGRDHPTRLKVSTNPEDLADHATETRFVAAAYYNDG